MRKHTDAIGHPAGKSLFLEISISPRTTHLTLQTVMNTTSSKEIPCLTTLLHRHEQKNRRLFPTRRSITTPFRNKTLLHLKFHIAHIPHLLRRGHHRTLYRRSTPPLQQPLLSKSHPHQSLHQFLPLTIFEDRNGYGAFPDTSKILQVTFNLRNLTPPLKIKPTISHSRKPTSTHIGRTPCKPRLTPFTAIGLGPWYHCLSTKGLSPPDGSTRSSQASTVEQHATRLGWLPEVSNKNSELTTWTLLLLLYAERQSGSS